MQRSEARPPIGIIATLIICTILYIAVVVVLTGLVPLETLMDDAAPVVNTLKRLHFGNVRLIVLIGALLGMISSLLVFQLGQARVWFAMSRDGLLPGIFSRVHKKFRTPDFSTWVAGFFVGIPAGLLDIGTLGGSFEYRHAVRLRSCRRRVLSCATGNRTAPAPFALRRPLAPIVTILTACC